MGDIFQYWSIAQLAPRVEKVTRGIDQSTVTGEVPLTPAQVEFFQHWRPEHRHHFNHAGLLFAAEGFDRPALRYALQKIQAHHDALRMTFREENGSVVQVNHGLDYPFSFEVIDIREPSGGLSLPAAVSEQAETLQGSLDPAVGPLMKAALFQCSDGERLFIVIHHLVLDAVSWNIILEDFERLYRYRRENPAGDTPPLHAKTDSFKTWAEQLRQYAQSPALLKEKAYWNRVESVEIEPLPIDYEGISIAKERELILLKLDEEETGQLLTEANEAFGTDINDLLLTALALSVREVFGRDRLLVAMEGHGREDIVKDIDTSRTVGWFTSVYPVLLEVSHGDTARRIIEIKDNLRRLPRKGIGYGILKYLTPEEHKRDITFRQVPQVNFNYLGQYNVEEQNSSFQFAGESTGDPVHPESRQEYLLEVFGVVSQNRLIMSISYNRTQYKKETVERLLAQYERQLKDIVSFCLRRQGRETTPADMDYKELSVEQLDNIFD
jgi:non-ribosomal peptide synthase protein (TIGR01720 family)